MNDLRINEQYKHNEITFFELLALCYKKRRLILTSVLICFTISLCFLFFSPPSYVAEALIKQPNHIDLSKINIFVLHKKESPADYSIQKLFALFINNLTSETLKQSFLSSSALSKRAFSNIYQLRERVKIKPTSGQNNVYSIKIKADSAEQSKTLLKQYIAIATELTQADLEKNIQYERRQKLLTVNSKITYLKNINYELFKYQLSILYSASREASLSGIHKFSSTNMRDSNLQLFMLGTQILNERIKTLKRSKYAPKILPELRRLEADKSFYSHISPSVSEIVPYNLDGGIYVLKSKKYHLLLLGVVLGLIIGLMTVFITYLSKKSEWKTLHANDLMPTT